MNFDSKDWVFSTDWLYVRHLVSDGLGSWKWSVRRHDNYEGPADADGVQSTPEGATEAMTAVLRELSGDERATFMTEAEQEAFRQL